jgi:hypothetical protein
MSYQQVFGGSTIYPSDVSYLALALDADTELQWPLEATASPDVLARIIDITPAGAYSVILAPADQTGTGQTILFNNLGPYTITVKDNAGGTVASIADGEQWQIYLTDNTTAAGSWQVFRYGAATSQAQASMLAGYGLTATGATLSQSTPVTTFNTNITLSGPSRAGMYLWNGGAGTVTLPAAATVGNGWFVNARNGGTGDLTVDPNGSELINDAATLTLQPGDSATIVSDGTGWSTVGFGQNAVFAFDYTSIDLTGETSPYTLSGAELNRVAYTFTGTLLADMEIVVPATIQQYWVNNDTSGSFTLGLRTPSQVTPENVTQGGRAILYSDGSDVVNASTSGIATPISIADGGTGATTASGARVNLGGTSVGIALFTASTTGAAWTALGVAPSGTVNGGTF